LFLLHVDKLLLGKTTLRGWGRNIVCGVITMRVVISVRRDLF